MMKRSIIITIISFLSVVVVNAQPAYSFLATSGTYTPISGGTLLTFTYNGVNNNDDGILTPANAINIGFTFNYNGTNYTTIRPCANGFAAFSNTALANNTDTWTNNLAGGVGTQRPILAPLWDDLDMTPGSVTWELSGTSPNQVLTIQWANARWQYSATAAVISFQLKLYETTNVIEFIYNQEAGALANAGDLGASIGISTGGTGNNSFMSLSDAGASPSYSTTVETSTIATKPANGQIYRWTPFCTAGANVTTAGTEKISNVTFYTINNNSTSNNGYENFSGQTALVQPAMSYPLSVSLSNGTADDIVYVWIDYNHNGDFSDAGELVYTSGMGAGPHTTNIAIPAISANVLLGNARMRVRVMNTATAPTNNTPCGNSELGQVEDYTINIQYCNVAAITTQPTAAITVCNGSNVSVNVAATGTTLTYQWQVSTDGGGVYNDIINGGSYAGATTTALTISGATVSMNGYMYRAMISGTCTPPTPSNAATLTVRVPAVINTSPVNKAVCVGNSTSFTVSATGVTPAYQWQVSTDGGINYSDIPGATTATYNITNATMALNGNRYRCAVTVTPCGAVMSAPGILTVNPLPVVTLSIEPLSAITAGQTTYVTVGSVAPGSTFSWTLNGTPIAGATGRSVSATINGLGSYRATVTDNNGCTNTSAALDLQGAATTKLFIYPNPSNGQFQIHYYTPYIANRTISIYNAAGRMVARKEFNVTTNYTIMNFDLRNLPAGYYTAHISYLYVTKTEPIAKFIIYR